MHFTSGIALLVEEIVPRLHGRSFAHRDANLAHDGCIESLTLHADGHLVDAGHIFALHHTFKVHVAEGGHFHAHSIVEVAFGAQHEDVGLNTHSLQFLHRVLGGLGLQFFGCFQIRYVSEVDTDSIATQLPAQLSDGFHEGGTLDVTNGSSHFGDDEIESPSPLQLPQGGGKPSGWFFPPWGDKRGALLLPLGGGWEGASQHPPLDFIRDMGHHLNGLAEIVTMTLAVNDGLVDATSGDGVVAGGVDTGETLVMSEVEVCLHAIDSDVALAMFVGIEGARVDVDVGVELLNGDLVATCLQEFADACRDDAFAQRGDHASSDEDVFCVHMIVDS